MTDFLLVETAAVTFIKAESDKARGLLVAAAQDPDKLHGTDARADSVAAWILASGATFRTGGMAELEEVQS